MSCDSHVVILIYLFFHFKASKWTEETKNYGLVKLVMNFLLFTRCDYEIPSLKTNQSNIIETNQHKITQEC